MPASHSKFFKLAAIAATLTSITTFLLWLLPRMYDPPATFELATQLYANPYYAARLWVNFIHIPLALLGYFAFAYKLRERELPKVSIGFVWFSIWGMTEMIGVSILIFTVNKNLRSSWSTLDDLGKQITSANIETLYSVWDSMFFVLLIAFLLASVFYGWASWRGKGLEKWLSYLIWLSVPLTIIIILSEYFGFAALGALVTWIYPVLQPVSRFLMGVYLWPRAGS